MTQAVGTFRQSLGYTTGVRLTSFRLQKCDLKCPPIFSWGAFLAFLECHKKLDTGFIVSCHNTACYKWFNNYFDVSRQMAFTPTSLLSISR